MLYVTVIGALFLTWFVLVLLFTPALNYHVRARVPVGSTDFLHLLESTCQAPLHDGNRVEVFTNGPCFYPAMLEAIRGARSPSTSSATSSSRARSATSSSGARRSGARRSRRDARCRRHRQLRDVAGGRCGTLTEAGCRIECTSPSRGTAWRA